MYIPTTHDWTSSRAQTNIQKSICNGIHCIHESRPSTGAHQGTPPPVKKKTPQPKPKVTQLPGISITSSNAGQMNLGNQSFQNPANMGMGLNQGPIVSEPRTLQGAEVAAVQIDNSNDEQIFYNPSGGTFKREPQIPAGVSISASSSQSNFGNQATTSFGNQVTNPVNKAPQPKVDTNFGYSQGKVEL